MSRPNLQLVSDWTSASGSTRVDTGTTAGDFTPTGIVDADGNHYFKGRPDGNSPKGTGGGNDGTTPLWKLDVSRDVQIAKWGLLALMSAFASAFLFFNDEFKDVRKDIASIQANSAAQTATSGAIRDTLSRIEDRLDDRDDKSETSLTSGQD